MPSEPIILTSLNNPRVKDIVHLRDRRKREDANEFIIEGYREILRALDSGHPIKEIFTCSEFYLGTNEGALIERCRNSGARLYMCTEALFRKMSYRDRPDGLIAIAPMQHLTLQNLQKKLANNANPFICVAEAIEKPGNLGTILRSSDAVGLDAMIVCDRCTDIYNPNVVRASVGTLFTVPVVEADGPATLKWLKERGIAILAATPSANYEFTEVDMTGPLAIVLGTEQLGLSERWMSQSDIQVRIPMCGSADSLNVAMAATLLMYEALRQRRRAAK